jgi:hypothetical protein
LLSRKTKNKSSIRKDYAELLQKDIEYDNKVYTNRLVNATKNINEEQLVENNIPMIDAPYRTHPYVHKEAEEEGNNDHGMEPNEEIYDFANSTNETPDNNDRNMHTTHDVEPSEANKDTTDEVETSDAKDDSGNDMHGKVVKPLVKTGGESIAFMLEPSGSSKKGHSQNRPSVLMRKPKSGAIMSESYDRSKASSPNKSVNSASPKRPWTLYQVLERSHRQV